MRLKKRYTVPIVLSLSFIVILLWYTDPFHKPEETISNLIGKDYRDALNYFGTNPTDTTSFSIYGNLNEFQGGVLSKSGNLKDSVVEQYTWEFFNHKVTIWVGSTNNSNREVIDAIRYKNNVVY